MIKAIEIVGISNNYKNKHDNKMLYISNLNKINIFIGENNSGKSRLLRYLINGNDTKVLNHKLNHGNKKLFEHSKSNLLANIKKYNNVSEIKIVLPKIFNEFDEPNYYCNVFEFIESLKIDSLNLSATQMTYYRAIKDDLDNMCMYLSRNGDGYGAKKVCEYDVTYIPILRGAENFNIYYQLNQSSQLDSIALNYHQQIAMNEYKENAKHIYSNKVSKTYNINKKNIFTAENLFDDIKNKLLSEEKDRVFIREFEEFISDEFYGGEGFTIIPQINEGYLNIKIGNGQERALHNLGDGIKQLITIFYKLFEKRNCDAIFFIEEPELNLHPGYQRQFIQILQNNENFSRHQYFITTHSNHMIDSCLNYENISIYKFINVENCNNTFKALNTNHNDIEILKLLGVYNSSVFISNCTIWVEGISDKILLSKYFDIYLKFKGDKQFKEDIHYSFIEYGGNNITHWSFIPNDDIATINSSGISNKCFIILDNDNDAPNKVKRKSNLKQIFKENYCELTVREIENTINRTTLEKTLFPDGNIKYKIKYEGNQYADKKTRMGEFIDKHYELSRKYGTKDTGTIINKLSFAKNVASNINDMSDLSLQAKNICAKIYDFVKQSNYK